MTAFKNPLSTVLGSMALVFLAFGLLQPGDGEAMVTPESAIPAGPVNIGDTAPELVFENPQGKKISLSSLRGKIVLVDFWASWCLPCRRENPNVVEAYSKYNKARFKNAKGFEIFSVSLDQDKNRWINAIKQDNLVWEYHVSDLKGWQSEAASIYQVNSIPAGFLVNEEGIVIARNLRGINLHYELDKLLK